MLRLRKPEAQAFQELMPVLQVQGRVLRGGEQAELPGAAGLADLAGLQVLTAEQVVNQLQAGPAERDGDADPQQLVRTRVQERVARGLARRSLPGRPRPG